MRWYQHSTQGAMPMTSPMNSAAAVATKLTSQARSSRCRERNDWFGWR
jgi:hypothetical protein